MVGLSYKSRLSSCQSFSFSGLVFLPGSAQGITEEFASLATCWFSYRLNGGYDIYLRFFFVEVNVVLDT